MRRCAAYLLSTYLPVRFPLQRSISDPFDLNAWMSRMGGCSRHIFMASLIERYGGTHHGNFILSRNPDQLHREELDRLNSPR
jgi:hypothetical protein